MEHNIEDLLKDSFSEFDIDFEDLQSGEGTQLFMGTHMDEMNGASKSCNASEQSSIESFTNIHKSEESEASSDNNECESTNSFTINTESTFCPSHEIDKDQFVNILMKEQEKYSAAKGNMQSDLAAGVSRSGPFTGFCITGDKKDTTVEEHMELYNVEFKPHSSLLTSSESQTPEEMSTESDDILPEYYCTKKQTSECESVSNINESVHAMSPNIADNLFVKNYMKEFTEEDQEQVEESLADYPSDLSQCEFEEPYENATAHHFTLTDISSSDQLSTNKTQDVSHVQNVNLQNKEIPALDHNYVNKDPKVKIILASADFNLLQRCSFDEQNVQVPNDRMTVEDAKNNEDAGNLSDIINLEVCISNSDDQSTNQEETVCFTSVRQEEEMNNAIKLNYSAEDMESKDDDIDCICPDTAQGNANSHEKQAIGSLLFYDMEEEELRTTSSISHDEESNTVNTELNCCTEVVQLDSAIKDQEKSSSEASVHVIDTKRIITEELGSSALLMDDDYLFLSEYDWDLTGEESFKIKSDNDNEERNERNWEMDKTRIEAFFRLYGDQAEPEDKVDRKHKVTLHLDKSSECNEDSDSTEEELDSDLITMKPQYHSESEDSLEEPYDPEWSKIQPKEQQPVAVKHHPRKNKCLAVLKSTVAFALMTAIGIVSFWWATEILDWIQ